MRNIKADVGELARRCEANREKHREVFERAVEGWRRAVHAKIAQIEEQLLAGDLVDLGFRLAVPVDHTADYDRAIAMLDMHEEPFIELSEEDFAQLVLDDWGWKREWTQTTSAYLSA